MLYSKTAEYAIRALTVMGLRPPGILFQVKQIAEVEPISPSFLSKIMRDLARARILKSARGPAGGFSLAIATSEISLWDIICIIDGDDVFDQCSLGLEECVDHKPCPMNESFKPLRQRIKDYLQNCSISDLSQGYSLRHQDRKTQLFKLLDTDDDF
jgi:Rrf2 family transcriptional regulator, iron-sulfur cluster assembly transcription factor